jgi:hypothetical protein
MKNIGERCVVLYSQEQTKKSRMTSDGDANKQAAAQIPAKQAIYAHVPMRMLTKAPVWLDQVIVHDTKDTKVTVLRRMILGKAEMESRFQPVTIGPTGVILGISRIAKPLRRWLGYIELFVGNDLDGRRHAGGAGVLGGRSRRKRMDCLRKDKGGKKSRRKAAASGTKS